ncbi:17009_t:CDS:2, partial [Cetraspora pellucida]
FKELAFDYPNNYNAKYYLALHYKNKNFINKNYNQAYKLLEQVAQSDSCYNDDAKYMLAKCYEFGDSNYNNDAKYMLAKYYKSGLGVEKNHNEALGFYLGLLGGRSLHIATLDAANIELAKCYNKGVIKDIDNAHLLYLDLSKIEKYQINAFK